MILVLTLTIKAYTTMHKVYVSVTPKCKVLLFHIPNTTVVPLFSTYICMTCARDLSGLLPIPVLFDAMLMHETTSV